MPDNTNLALNKPRYFTAIDGMRLLASVNVVLFHLQYIGGLHDMGGSPGWFFRLVKGPAFHASLFFILGGFIFTTKFAASVTDGSFKSWWFIKKRFSELYPLHLITTLTMAALYLIRRWGTDTMDIPNLICSTLMHLSFLWSFCPIGTMNLNTPSWALSAFFLCYVLFGPVLKWALCIKTRRAAVVWMALFTLPLAAWGWLYAAAGLPNHDNYYQFFHGFAPVRFFEFGLGMLLARFMMMREENKRPSATGAIAGLRYDAVFVLTVALIFISLSPSVRTNPAITWFSYHVLMIPLYLLMIYTVSQDKGIFARILSTKIIQKLGRTSFYPYLAHIPLISVITTFCERVLDYKKFLHSPLNILIFMILLYGVSYIYVYAVRNKRREKKKAKLCS